MELPKLMQNKVIFILFFGFFFLKINISLSQEKNIYNFSADKLTYSQNNNIIEASGNVLAKNQDGKKISSERIIYDKSNQILKSFGNSKFTDDKNRTLTADNFEYNLDKKIISAENKEKFLSNDKFNEFIEPRFSGKETTIKDNITIIKDAKFTSCKRTNEIDGYCPRITPRAPGGQIMNKFSDIVAALLMCIALILACFL